METTGAGARPGARQHLLSAFASAKATVLAAVGMKPPRFAAPLRIARQQASWEIAKAAAGHAAKTGLPPERTEPARQAGRLSLASASSRAAIFPHN